MPQGGTITAGVVTQTGSPIAMTSANGGPSRSFKKIRIKNTGTNAAAVGGSSVSLTNGYPLAGAESFELDALGVRGLYTIGTAGDKIAWLAVSD